MVRAAGLLAVVAISSSGQTAIEPAFAVASLKPSAHQVGKDARGRVTIGPDRLSGRNVSLRDLIVEAYAVEAFRVSGPGWLDVREFDIDARAGEPASRERLQLMLRALLAERFHLALHRDGRELPVVALIVDKGGPKIHPAGENGAKAADGPRQFRGDLHQFAQLLSIQLSIPTISDPTRPAMASGTPVPVLDKTGLAGVYEINVDIRPDGSDMFTLWQRKLQEQLGLKLERQRATLDFLVIDRADPTPTAN